MNKLSSTGSVLEVSMEVSNLMSDLEAKIETLYDLYTDNKKEIPKLPGFREMKSCQLRYELARKLTNCIDDAIEMKLRVSLLRSSFDEYTNIQSTSKADYNAVNNFKRSLKTYIDVLDRYRFELADIIKNANNKLNIINSFTYGDL